MPEAVAVDRLRQYVERIEKLEDEKKQISSAIRDVYAEAKAAGFDVKALRQVIRLRRMRPEERQETLDTLEVYRAALGI